MELGEKIRRARLEAGLSQRQLCGGIITRNMLSLIENGSARPSMDTLQYLAGQLGKSVSYFLEEAGTAGNAGLLARAREADPEKALKLLGQWDNTDPFLDPERHLLSALCRMKLAEQAVREGRNTYAQTLLAQAKEDGLRSPYFLPELEQRRLLLCYEAESDPPAVLLAQLQPDLRLTLLRAQAQEDPSQAERILDADPREDPKWHLLRAQVSYIQGQYEKALFHYKKAPETRQTLQQMEACSRELGDFKAAYEYACRLRE